MLRGALVCVIIANTCLTSIGSACGDHPKFPEPPILRSKDGVLSVELELATTEMTIGAEGEKDPLKFKTRSFNGQIPGPTLAVQPGDVLIIALVNNLGMESPLAPEARQGDVVAPYNCTQKGSNCTVHYTAYNHPNTTNLHTHGLHVSSLEPGDNVIDVEVLPGGSYSYTHRIPPDHAPGVFWYHPHRHRSVAVQTAGGAAGAIIIEDKGSAADAEDMPSRLVMLQTIPLAALRGIQTYSGGRRFRPTGGHLAKGWINNTVSNNQNPAEGPFQQRLMDHLPLVNGHSAPTLHLSDGKWEQLRLIHAGPFFYMDLSLEPDGDKNSDSNFCELHLTSTDGIPIMDGSREVKRVVLAPAGRADVAVRCHGSATWRLASGERPGASGLWNGDMYWAPLFMRVEVHDDGCSQPDPPLRASVFARPSYLRDLRNVASSDIDGKFDLTFADAKVVTNLTQPSLRYPLNGDGGGTCTFNGRIYNRNESLTTMRLGTVNEWRVAGVQGHPFHQHVNPYQIVEFLGGLQHNGCDAEYGHVCIGDWHDTLQIPNVVNITGAVVRFVTDRFVGEQVVHCHYLNHEDLGCIGFGQIAADNHPRKYDGPYTLV